MSTADLHIEMMELADLGQPVQLAEEVHRQLRVQFGSVPLRSPLEALANAVGIPVIEESANITFEGVLLIKDGVGAIGLKAGMRSGRRNFTLGHEIGHFLIPTHRMTKAQFQCAAPDMKSERNKSRDWNNRPITERIEVEANEFSAALLVPKPEFRSERRKLGAGSDVTHIRHLADLFDVSQEMMAGLYVKSEDELVAIVTSYRGEVRRVMPGEGFPYLGLRRGAPVPNAALTHTFPTSRSSGAISALEEVATHAWLDRAKGVTALYEQVFVQDDGWAMTLLTVDKEDEEDEVDDSRWNRNARGR